MDARSTAAAFALGALVGAGLALAMFRRAAGSHPSLSRGSSKGKGMVPALQLERVQSAASEVVTTVAEAVTGVLTPRNQNMLSDEIVSEQLTRNCQFFGMDAQSQVAKSFVVVVGLGGVGSHAAHLLLRSGVGRLRLVDFDLVTLSTLNRHAVATREDVGTPKATCMKKHFAKIFPESKVEAQVAMYTEDREEAVLSGRPDFVIDAIDNIDTKVALVAACVQRKLHVLCVGGAGAKVDPTRLRFADISESSIDPLARAMRHRLRREHNIEDGVRILLSTEKPRSELVSLGAIESGNPLDYQIVPGFRVRTIPVLGTSPALFGVAAASYVICELAGMPYLGEPIFRMQLSQYKSQFTRLMEREEIKFGSSSGVSVDPEEVAILIKEVWRGVSARCMGKPCVYKDKGLNRSTDHLVLTRWDSKRPGSIDNLILLTFEEAEAHDLASLQDIKLKEPEFFAYVESVLEKVRHAFGVQSDFCV